MAGKAACDLITSGRRTAIYSNKMRVLQISKFSSATGVPHDSDQGTIALSDELAPRETVQYQSLQEDLPAIHKSRQGIQMFASRFVIACSSLDRLVVWCSEFPATDTEARVPFPALRDFWEAVGLERGPLRLVSAIEELLGRRSSDCNLQIREYGRRGSAALTTRHRSIWKSWH
jgi:hypothetical protein